MIAVKPTERRESRLDPRNGPTWHLDRATRSRIGRGCRSRTKLGADFVPTAKVTAAGARARADIFVLGHSGRENERCHDAGGVSAHVRGLHLTGSKNQ